MNKGSFLNGIVWFVFGVVATIVFYQVKLSEPVPVEKEAIEDIEAVSLEPGMTFICNTYYEAIEIKTVDRVLEVSGKKMGVIQDDTRLLVPTMVKTYGKFPTEYKVLHKSHLTKLQDWRVDTLINIRRPIEECEKVKINR